MSVTLSFPMSSSRTTLDGNPCLYSGNTERRLECSEYSMFKIIESLIFTEAVLLRRNETLNYLELLEMNY